MTTLFVSDLHLSAVRPEKLELFARFVEHARSAVKEIYILGDLFEVWVGDDDNTPAHRQVINALATLTQAGVSLFVAHGNRDFLFGGQFARETGAHLLADYTVIDLHGRPALLTHGDLLCTRDVKYQKFRRVVRNPIVRAMFLAAPLSWRKRIALRTQSGTKASMAGKPGAIMDVDQQTVAAVMEKYQTDLLIHGHTHRPQIHEFERAGRRCQRIVLGDWYEQDQVLVCDDERQRRMRISEFLST